MKKTLTIIIATLVMLSAKAQTPACNSTDNADKPVVATVCDSSQLAPQLPKTIHQHPKNRPYTGYVAVGIIPFILGAHISTTHGVTFKDRMFVGGGFAADLEIMDGTVFLSPYAAGRINFKKSRNTPFFELKVGMSIPVPLRYDDYNFPPCFYMCPAFGVSSGRLEMLFAYSLYVCEQELIWYYGPHFSIGYRF